MHEGKLKKTRGRPRKEDKEIRNCTLNINVTADIKWEVSDLADKQGITISDYLRVVIEDHLKEIRKDIRSKIV